MTVQLRMDTAVDAFPHDRVALFSDAVFAIAITLLVIEIHIPGRETVAQLGMANALHDLIPLFIGFLVSFLVTALFWVAHLQTWKYVITVTPLLLWLNIMQLLFVALMPFSTGLYAQHVGDNASFSFYCLNLAAISLFAYLMRLYVIRHEGLVERLGRARVAWMRQRSMTSVFVFLGCIPLAYLQPWLGRLGFLMIFVVHALLRRHHGRRAADEAQGPVDGTSEGMARG